MSKIKPIKSEETLSFCRPSRTPSASLSFLKNAPGLTGASTVFCHRMAVCLRKVLCRGTTRTRTRPGLHAGQSGAGPPARSRRGSLDRTRNSNLKSESESAREFKLKVQVTQPGVTVTRTVEGSDGNVPGNPSRTRMIMMVTVCHGLSVANGQDGNVCLLSCAWIGNVA